MAKKKKPKSYLPENFLEEHEKALERRDRMIFGALWVGSIILALWLLSVTGPKLYKMTQIRGWTSGATITEKVITDKASEDWEDYDRSTNRSSRGTTYWVAWDGEAALLRGSHRVNLDRYDWDEVDIGDSLEIITFPNDRYAYVKNSIFASNGNFIFDVLLLFAEMALLVYASLRLLELLKPAKR